MADPEFFIVGVPGMGNADLSWHQRRPYGFSRCGYSKVQARVHAYRRPSTASGRLSSQAETAYRPAPPQLAANRLEYWGAGSNSNAGHSNSDVSRGGYRRQQRFSRQLQGPRGLRARERPLSAGCHPASSPSTRVPISIAACGTTAAVESCTRNRAGIVRGGGRYGRAAPPPTPPPPRSPYFSHVAASPPASQRTQGQQPSLPPGSMRRRRPSTAGSKRSPNVAAEHASYGYYRQLDHASARGVSAEGVPADDAIAMSPESTGVGGTHGTEERRAPREGAELAVCPHRPPAGNMFGCQEHPFSSSQVGHGSEVGQATCQASAAAGTTITPSHAQSPRLNRSIVYRRSSRDERGAAAGVAGCRRRPASAAPPRSRATITYDRFQKGSEGGGGSSDGSEIRFGHVSAVEPSRGRSNARTGGRGTQRPRSASAATGRRASVSDVDAFTPVAACGVGLPSPSVARPRAQSASTPSAVVPSFVLSEKQVLRFFGHLTEELDWGCGRSAAVERTGELSPPTLKIRQVVLHLYLGDGSLEIFEKHQANSGQQGGLLLRRNLFKKRDGSLYGVGDLKVGGDLKLLGRSYRLTGCDDYTRKWYENEGFHQPEEQQAPEETNQRLRVEDTTGLCNKPQRPHTATSHRPPSAGRSAQDQTLRRAHQQKIHRFFRHDKETLRFKAVWDDPTYGGTRRRYDLLLFLEDETLSLLNPREDHRNSGRDESMVHVRRQRLPKDWKARNDVYSGGEGGGGDGDNGFVGELDLAVGRTVHVWGRAMKLVGCDPFTQAYYRRKHGIEMAASLDEEASERSTHRARRVYDPSGGNRWSTEGKAAAVGTDYLTASLGQYEGGAPSGTFPVDRYKGHRIRCKALLRSNMPNDKGREFVVTYDLALDTLMVYELQRRNSGRPGGLFLVKGKHRRPDKNNRYYVPQDLFLGAVVPLVTGHTLVITEMERSTLALCEENPNEFPLMDSQRVLGRVVQRARNMRLALRSELQRRAADPVRGNVSPFRAPSSGGGGGSSRSGVISPSSFPMTSAAAAANMSSWPAGKVLTNGNSGSPRQDQPRAHPTAAPPAVSPRREPATGSHATGSPVRGYTASSKGSHHNGNDGAPNGKRVRSGATWGLVGGWGDVLAPTAQAEASVEDAPGGKSSSSNNSSERRVVVNTGRECGSHRPGTLTGNPKNESATAPWAAIQAAGVNVFTSNSGQAVLAARAADSGSGVGVGATGTKRSGEGDNDPYSFEDHAAFRDAMDDLGLLVGLGQQEVLTLVRAFTGKRGKSVNWASMCDRMSQIAAATTTTPTQDCPGARNTVGGVLAARRMSYSPVEPLADDVTLLRRLREAGVAWRSVFARVREDSAKGTSGGACLGVASLVQAMRRNGLVIGAGDAAFLARRFSRGGGSQVDYNRLCDEIYPCDFSSPATSSSPNSTDEGRDRGSFPSSSSASPRPPCSLRHAPSADLGYCHPPPTTNPSAIVANYHTVAGGGAGRSSGGGRGEGLGIGKGRRTRAPSCDFDIGGGGGNGGGGGGGVEGAWSLWDREKHPPELQPRYFCRDDGNVNANLERNGRDNSSSQYWDEENAILF